MKLTIRFQSVSVSDETYSVLIVDRLSEKPLRDPREYYKCSDPLVQRLLIIDLRRLWFAYYLEPDNSSFCSPGDSIGVFESFVNIVITTTLTLLNESTFYRC